MDVLVKFYSKVRPFGFWGPVRREAERRGAVPVNDPMPRIDVMNGFITVVFQVSLALIPFYLFLRELDLMSLWIGVCIGARGRPLFHLVQESSISATKSEDTVMKKPDRPSDLQRPSGPRLAMEVGRRMLPKPLPHSATP